MDYNTYDKDTTETNDNTAGRKKFGIGLILGILIGSAVTIGGVLIGTYLINPPIGGRTAEVLDRPALEKLALISSVMEEKFYAYDGQDPSDEDMRTGIYKGLVSAYGDKYSAYYTAEELQDKREDNYGYYYGIGAYLSVNEELNYPVITGVMEDAPAEKAGLHGGDIIAEVDGVSTYGYTSSETADVVRGDIGTTVHLKIFREGEPDYLDFDVVRDKVESRTAAGEMLEGDIGYIQIAQFELATVDQFTQSYQKLRDEGAKGLILDLRGNPGGMVASVLEIGRQILPEGLIYYTEDAAGNRTGYSCDGANEIDIPLVVLVDQYSASSSEILTGAIKDYGIGTIVGTTTYGKGIVQNVIPLEDGSGVEVTASAYFSPKGNNIHGKGIEPDIEIEFDPKAYYNDGVDNQLERAKEEIKSKLK